MTYIMLYLACAVPFWLADGVWLGLIAKNFYRDALGPLMTDNVQVMPAVIFYLLYPAGLAYFVVMPHAGSSLIKAAFVGGLFGLFCYATYDLVNQSTLKGWPWRLTLVDMTWGTLVSAACASIAVAITR